MDLLSKTCRQGLVMALVFSAVAPGLAHPAASDSGDRLTTVVGTVRDEQNAITLPGVTVTVVGSPTLAVTDVDGRYSLRLAPGIYELKVGMDGYQERTVKLTVAGERTLLVDVPIAMNQFAEEVTVTASVIEAETSSAAAQLVERKNAQVITDNIGSQEMRANGDSDAASALQRVTGLSVVDNQYVFVRGLGERYSNTTLAGSVLPTTEPDKKVVPLDIFPASLIDSVQVSKSYSPDRSADFAGGLVQVVPTKVPSRPVLDTAFGLHWSDNATGERIPLSPLDGNDLWGYDGGARALPGGFPDGKVVRRGIYTPTVGYSRDEITAFGRLLENRWLPANDEGQLGPQWNVAFGSRFGKLGIIASATHQYRESYVRENRRFFRIADEGELEAVSDYVMDVGTQKAQLGIVGNAAWQFSPNHRIAFENFYTNSGRDEGRVFEGPNTENNFYYKNYRVQFIQERLLANAVAGEHYVPALGNSRVDYRVSYAQAARDEPDLRETLYQRPLVGGTLVLADESQSGFRMFNELDDETLDVQLNWSLFGSLAGRPTLYKFGPNYVHRTRDFASRRFRFIPTNARTIDLSRTPESLYASENIGVDFRFNEETRPVDAYDADQTTLAGYGMVDMAVSGRARLVAGLRVEQFDLEVNTFDPFGLFIGTVQAKLDNTDWFPGVNFVYSLRPDMNLRGGFSQTTNRPEFRELAAFEFTDVVGNRSVRGNPELQRSLIRNLDARWEMFSGDRSVLAASVFYKDFDDPIERVIIAGAQPSATFQNAERASNFGIEIEAAREFGRYFYVSANYTFVDSEITLSEEARRVQTSLSRPLAGQSRNLFNLVGEFAAGGFQARALYNYFDDRISDVGANGAPDIVEAGRGSLDLVLLQRLGRFGVRVTLENLTDSEYLFTQGPEEQRLYKLGRTATLGFAYSFF
jgi:hypothetical protein